MRTLFFLLLLNSFLGCTPHAEKKKYRMPSGFKGQVFIFFNRIDGAAMKYEKGYRIYDIPANGILKTQFRASYGYFTKGDLIYVYVDSLGTEVTLNTYARDNTHVKVGEVYITGEETGSGGIDTKYEYETFNVKTINDSLILGNRISDLMDSVLRKAGIK